MTKDTKVLVVDDDPHIAELICLYLNKEGYETLVASAGKEALVKFKEFSPQLILLDLMLPEMDGYQVCREIRQQSTVPIIMLTAKGEVFDKVLGLEMGADDYIVKPFEPKELLARVKAVLRRADMKEDVSDVLDEIVFPNLVINHDYYSVMYHEKELELPPKEFELLYFLGTNVNQVFTRDQLLDKIWGYDFAGDSRTVDVHVKRVREKLDMEDSWSVKTVWGVGYKFEYKE